MWQNANITLVVQIATTDTLKKEVTKMFRLMANVLAIIFGLVLFLLAWGVIFEVVDIVMAMLMIK